MKVSDVLASKGTVVVSIRPYQTIKEAVDMMEVHNIGGLVVVNEDRILPGRDQLAHRGLFVEPTSAMVWDGLFQVVSQIPAPIVVILMWW